MRRAFPGRVGLPLCALVGASGCAKREESPPAITVTGHGVAASGPARRDETARSPTMRALADGSEGPLDRTPVEQLLLVLDGYTRAKRDVARSAESLRPTRALFYCAELNADFRQCVLFDGADAGAHVIGVEYVISPQLYATLPHGERQYWHAHMGEIDSGVLVSPGLSDDAHTELMSELRPTYGKSWRLWDTDHDPLPYGEPTLMWSIAPGKLEPSVRTEMRSRRQR